MVNLEIRAGTPREDALRMLAERTGLSDVSSLVSMLIQTDRFGTSVANALRVQAARSGPSGGSGPKRPRPRRPSSWFSRWCSASSRRLFVVILGPAMIQILQTMGGL